MSTPRGVVAGIDSSTQSCTVELRDAEDGRLLGTGAAPHPPTTPPVSEQDPAAWWSALRTALAAALEAAGVRGSDVVAISVSAQCHGLVPLDATGAVIRPAKLWNDTTAAEYTRRLQDRIGRTHWIRAVGSLPTAAFTLGKVAWFADQEPAVYSRLQTVLLPHDWLTFRLTGRHVTDRSEASGTGYYDASSDRWLPDLLAHVDTDRDWLAAVPNVAGPAEAAGTLAPTAATELGLSERVVVGPGGGDQHVAALGLGIRPGDYVYSLGTSGVVYTTNTEPVYDEQGRVDGVADAAGGFLPLVSTLNAARVTDVVAELLGVDHATLSDLALSADRGGERPVLAAFLDGERTPNLPGATGLLAGLTTGTARADLALAAYEGVVLGLLAGRDALAEVGLPATERVLITGGGARSAAYVQVLADLGDHPVERPDVAEASARGACVQAAAVLAGTTVREVSEAWSPTTEPAATPRPDRGTEQLRERYRRLAAWRELDR